jgi:hypothetical protein
MDVRKTTKGTPTPTQANGTSDNPAATKLTKSHAATSVVDEPMMDVKSELGIVKEEVQAAGGDEVGGTDAAGAAVPSGVAATAQTEMMSLVLGNAPAKKKKKKKGYKDMMASMMNPSSERDVEKEKDDAIRKVTGGGAFAKVDKI